jgi:hypothetical protein
MESAQLVDFGLVFFEHRQECRTDGVGNQHSPSSRKRAIRWPLGGRSLCAHPAFPCSVIPSPSYRRANFGKPRQALSTSSLGLVQL